MTPEEREHLAPMPDGFESSRKIKFQGMEGHELTGKIEGVSTRSRMRMLCSDTTLYMLLAFGDNDFTLSEDATRFLDSLRVLETK